MNNPKARLASEKDSPPSSAVNKRQKVNQESDLEENLNPSDHSQAWDDQDSDLDECTPSMLDSKQGYDHSGNECSSIRSTSEIGNEDQDDDDDDEQSFDFESNIPQLIEFAILFDQGKLEDPSAYFEFHEEDTYQYSGDNAAESDDTVPMRKLIGWSITHLGEPINHVSIYDWILSHETDMEFHICARGFVKPIFADEGTTGEHEDDLEASFNTTYLSTTAILDHDVMYSAHGVSLWIKTQHAWYLLESPRSDQLSFDGQWLLRHYMSSYLHTIVCEDHAKGLRGELCRSVEGVCEHFTPPKFLLDDPDVSCVWEACKETAFDKDDMFYDSLSDNLQTWHTEYIFSFSHPISKFFKLKAPLKGDAKAKAKKKNSSRAARNVSLKPESRPSAITPMVNSIRQELSVFAENVELYGNPKIFVYPPGPSPLRVVPDSNTPIAIGDVIKFHASTYLVSDMTGSRAHLLKVVDARETLLGSFAPRGHLYVVPECTFRSLKNAVRLPGVLIQGLFTGNAFKTFHFDDDCPKCGQSKSPMYMQNSISLDDLPEDFANPLLTSESVANECYEPIQTGDISRVLVRNEWVHEGDFVYFRMKPTALPSHKEMMMKSKTFSKARDLDELTTDTKRQTKLKWSDDQYLYAIGRVEHMWQDVIPPDLDLEEEDETVEEQVFVSRAPSSIRMRVSLLGRWDSLYHGDPDVGTHPRRLFYTHMNVEVKASNVTGTLCIIPLAHALRDYFEFPNNFVLVGEHPFHNPLEYLSAVLHQPTSNSQATDVSLLRAFTGSSPIVNQSASVLVHLNIQIKSLLFERGWKVPVPQLLYNHNPVNNKDENKLSKLRALDLFSGCGGLTVGFDRDALATCDTKWACEMDQAAVQSFKANFGNSTIFLEDANNLLRAAIDAVDQGQAVKLRDGTVPLPGEVDVIYCGPPCQGFSRMNSSPKCDDHKNTLIPASLSFVELYRPKVVMIENVTGMLRYRLGGVQKGQHTVEGGFRGGVPRFIVRVLLSLGYQVTWHVAQAGNYGAPQSRRRVLFLATLPQIKLPSWPEPTHHFMLERETIAVRDSDLTLVEPITAWNEPQVFCDVRTALFPNVTVRCIISDLPPYDWENSNTVMQLSEEALLALRSDLSIQTVNAVHPDGKRAAECGLVNPKYALPPKSEIQRYLRGSRAGDWDGIKDHFMCPGDQVLMLEQQALSSRLLNYVNKTFRSEVVERVCHIARNGPFKDHRSLPAKIEPWALDVKNPKSACNNYWAGLYGRLNMDGQFRTVVTNPDPMGKNGTLLHPIQNRLMTVRELGRAQTFPDWFMFKGNVTDQYRQVGNAVPPILGTAINRSLFTALLHSPLHSVDEKMAREILQLPALVPGHHLFIEDDD